MYHNEIPLICILILVIMWARNIREEKGGNPMLVALLIKSKDREYQQKLSALQKVLIDAGIIEDPYFPDANCGQLDMQPDNDGLHRLVFSQNAVVNLMQIAEWLLKLHDFEVVRWVNAQTQEEVTLQEVRVTNL